LASLILTQFEALPGRIASAMSQALQEQHRAILHDVDTVIRNAISEIKSVN
jgi:hypothetical protein